MRRRLWRDALAQLAHMVPNPMLRTVDYTQDGKLSERTLAATAARVYQVVEFDFRSVTRQGNRSTIFAPLICGWLEQQITVADACATLLFHLARLMPLAMVVHSGEVSLHGWFKTFGLNHSTQRTFFSQACHLGADPMLWDRSHFVRVPDGTRENGARQCCFYLNPKNCISV